MTLRRLALVAAAALITAWYAWSARASFMNNGLVFVCSLDSLDSTRTECQPSPGPDQRIYITDIVAQSTTATAGQFVLRYGTGTNCGTDTLSILPQSAPGVVRLTYPGTGSPPLVISFKTPLILPKGQSLCVSAVATNTLSIQIQGEIKP